MKYASQTCIDGTKIPINERIHQDLGEILKYSWARVPKSGWSNDCWSAEDRINLFGSLEQEKAFGLKAVAMGTKLGTFLIFPIYCGRNSETSLFFKEQKIFTVSEFIDFLNTLLIPQRAIVQGEIGGKPTEYQKFTIFNLLDKDKESILNCFSWQVREKGSGTF